MGSPAAVVQKIFYLCMSGMGTTQIANWLREQKIFSPTAYHLDHGRKTCHEFPKNPYKWSTQTISSILRKLEYLGHTVNFRTTTESYKSSRLLHNSPEDWVIIENTQEPINNSRSRSAALALASSRIKSSSYFDT